MNSCLVRRKHFEPKGGGEKGKKTHEQERHGCRPVATCLSPTTTSTTPYRQPRWLKKREGGERKKTNLLPTWLLSGGGDSTLSNRTSLFFQSRSHHGGGGEQGEGEKKKKKKKKAPLLLIPSSSPWISSTNRVRKGKKKRGGRKKFLHKDESLAGGPPRSPSLTSDPYLTPTPMADCVGGKRRRKKKKKNAHRPCRSKTPAPPPLLQWLAPASHPPAARSERKDGKRGEGGGGKEYPHLYQLGPQAALNHDANLRCSIANSIIDAIVDAVDGRKKREERSFLHVGESQPKGWFGNHRRIT